MLRIAPPLTPRVIWATAGETRRPHAVSAARNPRRQYLLVHLVTTGGGATGVAGAWAWESEGPDALDELVAGPGFDDSADHIGNTIRAG